MTTALEAILEGRQRIIAQEAEMARQMLEAYDLVAKRVERELRSLDWAINQAVARGRDVPKNWLMDQAWYRQLQASIDQEVARFHRVGTEIIWQTQVQAIYASAATASAWQSTLSLPFVGRVNRPAFERWVSAMQPGSPIRVIMDRYGDDISRAIRNAITEGIGAGSGVNPIIRDLMDKIGTDITEPRLRTLIRTESMRAYRGGFADTMATYEERGMITGYMWLSDKSARTCLACLMMDGTVTKKYPTTFHVGCRCVATPVLSEEYVPASGRPRETGAEWFAKQDEKVQRRVLITPGRYKAYKDGVPLSDMVTTRRNNVWGSSIAIKPMRDMGL